MHYYSHQHSGRSLQLKRLPWLMFLILSATLFLADHDLFYSKRGIDSYGLSDDQVISEVSEGTPVRRIALLSLGAFAIACLVRQRVASGLRIDNPLGWILLSFGVWALASPIWAEDLALTVRRTVVFAILCIAAFAVARRFSRRELILWTLFTTTLFLVIGIIAEVVLGTFRPFASGYRFAGTLHPNIQAVNCAFLLISGVAAADIDKRKRNLFWAFALLGVAFLILTVSRTAFLATFIAVAAYLSVVCSRSKKIALVCVLSVGLSLLSLFVGNALLPDLKSVVMLGRDASSTDSFDGRTGVWEECAYYVIKRPIAGYGFGGFWNPKHIDEISTATHWEWARPTARILIAFCNSDSLGSLRISSLFFSASGVRSVFSNSLLILLSLFVEPCFSFAQLTGCSNR